MAEGVDLRQSHLGCHLVGIYIVGTKMANPQGYSVTAAEVATAYRSAEADLKHPTRGPAYQVGITQQRELELAALGSAVVCPAGVSPAAVTAHLSGLRPAELKTDASQRFYSGAVMEAVSCVASSLYVDQGPHALAATERVRAYITSPKQMGAESVSGYAMSASLGQRGEAKSMFVLKAPRDPSDANELVHEVAVGFYGLNALRRGTNPVPNFAYIHGMFNCTAPVIDAESKAVASWCASATGGAVAYAIYESVAPSVSLRSFAATAPASETLRAYLGTMTALRAAFLQCGFTHYDLHDENVLECRREEGIFYVPTQTARGLEYMEYDKDLPTVIDYGMSHIQVRDRAGQVVHLGHVSHSAPLTMFGVNRDRPNIMHDAYKLLCMLLSGLRSSNPRSYAQLSPLLLFFNRVEPPDVVIASQQATFYALPYNETVLQLSLDDWIAYVRGFFATLGVADPLKASLPAGSMVLQCTGDCTRLTAADELKAVGIDSTGVIPAPTTFLEFSDVMGTLQSTDPSGRAATELAGRFASNLNAAYNFERSRVLELQPLLAPFVIYRLPRPLERSLNAEVLAQLKYSATQVARFLDTWRRLTVASQGLRYAIGVYNIPASHPIVLLSNQLTTELSRAQPIYNAIRVGLLEDWTALQSWPQAAMVQREARYAPFKWYWSTYPTLVATL